jgi:hypothetical protein
MKRTNTKLSLRLDDLRIDSFTTDAAGTGPRGTVRANQDVEAFGKPTDVTCANTCGCYTWADNSCYPQTYCIG